MINSLRGDKARLSNSIAEMERQIGEETAKRQDDDEMLEAGLDRKTLLEAHGTLMEEMEALDKELSGYTDNDPVETLRKIEETKKIKDSAIRWTDNIEAIESFISSLTMDRAQTAEIMTRACGDEYVTGEGMKDLGFRT